MKKVCVFGGGSFGTAMASAAARNGHDVVILLRDEKVCESINKEHINSKYVSGLKLPDNVRASTSLEECMKDVNFIIHSIPAQQTPDFLSHRKDQIPADVPLISTSKGIYVPTQELMSDIIPKSLGRPQPLAYLSGPSFAKEVIRGQPTAVVVASTDSDVASAVQSMMSSETFRVYTSHDVIGVEVGGALKNPLAIGAGIVQGLGYEYNSLGMFVTRGCSEMKKLALAMGGHEQTLAGLSGIGDLMLTAFGSLSRNRSVGFRIGQGETLQQIIDSMNEVAEGVPTAGGVVKLAEKYKLDLPIFQTVYNILEGNLTAQEAVKHLMSQPLREED